MEQSNEQKINIRISQDEKKMNKAIHWTASGKSEDQACKALLLSLWNGEENLAYKVDLWTTEMTVEEMNHFMYQSFMSMSDTFERATGNQLVAIDIKNFAANFAKKTGVAKQ